MEKWAETFVALVVLVMKVDKCLMTMKFAKHPFQVPFDPAVTYNVPESPQPEKKEEKKKDIV